MAGKDAEWRGEDTLSSKKKFLPPSHVATSAKAEVAPPSAAIFYLLFGDGGADAFTV